MKRGSPLFVQALGLVVLTAIAAQLVTLVSLLALPDPREVFTFGDVAEAIEREEPIGREGQILTVTFVDSAPAEWEKDAKEEIRAHKTLTNALGTDPANLRIEFDMPVPGLTWVSRLRSPVLSGEQPDIAPYDRGSGAVFEDFAAAARKDDGRWVIVRTPSNSLGLLTFLLIWLGGNVLLLVPLAWLFTRRLVAPIRAFADAAYRAGRGEREVTFTEAGPREVRQSARALAEMQRRIAGAVEERTRLIAAIAHDLRAPLTRMRFRAEYAAAEHREKIVQEIERMDAMIGGVLAFARGEERMNRQRLDLASLVESVADDFAESGTKVDVDATAIEVCGDGVALRRLFANLIDNAVKYGSAAHCCVVRDGSFALVVVEDEGPGLADEDLERLFRPFERGGAARDPATGGVGLGLALARGIARAHGGDVELSLSPDQGLRASVYLPIDSKSAA